MRLHKGRERARRLRLARQQLEAVIDEGGGNEPQDTNAALQTASPAAPGRRWTSI